jgi:glutathione S-transferase
MRILHHHPLYGASRTVRLLLAERKLVCLPKMESPWERHDDFLTLNPAGEVPVLVTEDGVVLVGTLVIAEFLEETEDATTSLIWGSAAERAEIRRLTSWFEQKFVREVGAPLLNERYIKRVSSRGNPSSEVMRAAITNLHIHLDYIDWLAEQGNWLAGKAMSLADLSAAAHLSVTDYFGDVDWDRHPEAKEWYAKIKSRPSFRDLLADVVAGLAPAQNYGDLDF